MSKEQENPEEVYEKLKNSKFKQQRLPAWRPVPTITSTTIIFIAFGVLFIILGIIIIVYSNKIVEIKKEYKYDSGKSQSITIDIEKDMDQPIMVYYQLDGFYQNHRRYVKSKNDDQLNGKKKTLQEIKDSGDCDPVITNKEMGKLENYKGESLEPNELAVPCGLIAKSYFNDKYKNWKLDGKDLTVDESGIAWDADIKMKYKNQEDMNKQWINMTDEHFIVWMRPAGLKNFRKLWGRIKTDLKKGQKITVDIENNYDVTKFDGKKYLVFSTVNSFGGKNKFLGISYIVVGAICIALAVVFVIGYNMHKKHE